MTRRIALACLVFIAGVAVGIALLRPAHHGRTRREREVAVRVAAASGGEVVHVACAADHCGAVVRPKGSETCQGWVVPLSGGMLGAPRRAALADC